MVALRDILVVVFSGVALLAALVVLVAWRHRAARGATSVAAVMFGAAIWSGAYAVVWSVSGLDQQALWEKVTSLGSWIVPVGYLTLALDIARMDKWRTPGFIGVIASVSFVLNNLEWPNPWGLFNAGYVAHMVGPNTYFEPIRGPLYWAFIVYAYVLIVLATLILARVSLRSSGPERREALVLLVGGLAPSLGSAITISGLGPPHVDLAPIAFVITGTLWLTATVRGTLLDILPMARDILVEQMFDGIVVVGSEGEVVDANPAALGILRARSATAFGESAEKVFSSLPGASEVLDGTGPRRTVLPMGPDSETGYVEMGVTPLQAEFGRSPAQLVTLHDVTGERRADEGLRLARQVFDTASEAILVMRPNAGQQIADANEAYCRLTGRSRQEVIDKEFRSFRSERHPPEFYDSMTKTLFGTGEWKGEVWQTRVDGTAFLSWLSLSMARDEHGRASNIVGIFSDITEIRNAEERLRFNATHDALTGLPNRLLLDDRLNREVAHARRTGTGLALLFVDLDNFKDINDSLGHGQGDALLVEVADRICAALEDGGVAGRFGGDEFAIIMADVLHTKQVENTARRVLEAVASPEGLGPDDPHVTASIGIALLPNDSEDSAGLVKHADLAMHSAKELGHNRIQFFSQDLQENLDRRIYIEKELWDADKEDRYFLLYQPQIDLSTGEVTGAEALVRLLARDGSVLSPVEFLPVAEDSDITVRLGNWVLQKACSDLALLHEIAPELTVSVNFSARQFKGIDAAAIHEIMRLAGIEPRHLAMEIAESSLMNEPREAAARLSDFRDMAGAHVSLDDFGTGYSSLTYVRMFRADTLKIDRTIIRLLPDDPEAQAIVLSTIALSRGLQARVIAEGPETEDQVRFLRANGCDCAQGYYFSLPVSADEFAALLRRGPFALPEI